MAEEVEGQEEVIEEQPKKKKNILLIVIIVVLFLVIIGMGVTMYMFMNGEENPNGEPVKQEKVEKKVEDMETIEKQTEQLIVNIQGSGRTYLKIQMTLVFDGETFDEEIYNKKAPYMTDAIISVLSSKVKEELATYGGKIDVKDELKTKLNMVLPKELEISKILFTTFVMQ